MTSLARLQRGGLGGQIAAQLTDLIVDGTLAAAQALPTERELAKEFGVSIGVVREAINSLTALGLVEVRHGVGSFVNPRERWNTATPMMLLVRSETSTVLDVYDVRAPLEMAAVEWAARRATSADLLALDKALTRMRETLHQQEAFAAADLEYHVTLAQGAHNRMLLTVLRPLLEPIRDCILHITHIPIAATRAVTEHEEISAAVSAHKVVQARDAMRRHLRTTREELVAVTKLPARSRVDNSTDTRVPLGR